jgi:hypothetical protein
MAIELVMPRVFVVALGDFQPAAATAAKLGEGGVIRADEAEAAKYTMLVPGQAIEFALDWCRFGVGPNRLIVETWVPPFIRIADLVQKTLLEMMPLACVQKLGINLQYTIKFSSIDEKNKFGSRLSPPSAWGAWGRAIEAHREKQSKMYGGVTAVTMREIPVEGRDAGWRDIQIAAGAGEMDAYMLINDHFEGGPKDQSEIDSRELGHRRTAYFMQILREQFDLSLNAVEKIALEIIHS